MATSASRLPLLYGYLTQPSTFINPYVAPGGPTLTLPGFGNAQVGMVELSWPF